MAGNRATVIKDKEGSITGMTIDTLPLQTFLDENKEYKVDLSLVTSKKSYLLYYIALKLFEIRSLASANEWRRLLSSLDSWGSYFGGVSVASAPAELAQISKESLQNSVPYVSTWSQLAVF